MRITVLGATGGTGRQVLKQAMAKGYEVTAVVRNPAALSDPHPLLTVVKADVLDPKALVPLVEGRDAVVSTLGHRGPRQPTTVCADSAAALVEAMHATDVRRLIVVSASGMVKEGDGPLIRLVAKPILQRVLRHAFADMRAMEKAVMASGLDWTVIRPPMLTDGPHTGSYRTAVGRNVRGGFRVSRADLADCILRCLADHGPLASTVGVGN